MSCRIICRLLSAALTEPLACGVHAIEKGNYSPGDICVVFGVGAIGQMVMQWQESGATVIVAGLSHDANALRLQRVQARTAVLTSRPENIKRYRDGDDERCRCGQVL